MTHYNITLQVNCMVDNMNVGRSPLCPKTSGLKLYIN